MLIYTHRLCMDVLQTSAPGAALIYTSCESDAGRRCALQRKGLPALLWVSFSSVLLWPLQPGFGNTDLCVDAAAAPRGAACVHLFACSTGRNPFVCL